MRRLTRDQMRLIIDLLDKETDEFCSRLDPEQEGYVGQPQHDLSEGHLSQAAALLKLRFWPVNGTIF